MVSTSQFIERVTSFPMRIRSLLVNLRELQEDPYSKRLQPAVSTAISYTDGCCLVLITATVENPGQAQVNLDHNKTLVLIATRKLGDPEWTDDVPRRIFGGQDAVQPNETISDQIWFELPNNNEVALRTDFVVAKVVKEEDTREDEVVGWRARDTVNLLDIRGKIKDTSSGDDVESEG